MKKLLLIFIFLTIVPLVLAASIDMKSTYNQGETLIAKVSGNFVTQITGTNVFLYRENTRIPFEPAVTKINDDFYIAGQLSGKTSGNYSLQIRNVQYQEGTKIISDTIAQNFTLTDNQTDFSITPGAISSTGNFTITVQNLNPNSITLSTTFTEGLISLADTSDSSITLKSGEVHKINFNVVTGSYYNEFINLTSENQTYEVPVSISPESAVKDFFRFEPSNVNVSLGINSDKTYIVYLYNLGSQNLNDITLTVSDPLASSLSLSEDSIKNLASGSKEKIELKLKSSSDAVNLEGQITAQSADKFFAYLPVFMNILSDYNASVIPENVPTSSQTCEQLSGIVCGEGQTCSVNIVNAKNENCCLGTCSPVKKSSAGLIIGIILLIVIIAFITWFFLKKFKKTNNKPLNLVKVAEQGNPSVTKSQSNKNIKPQPKTQQMKIPKSHKIKLFFNRLGRRKKKE